MKKRLLAILLCMIMMLQTMAISSAAIDSTGTQTDPTPDKYSVSAAENTEYLQEIEPQSIEDIINFEIQIQLEFPVSEDGVNLLKDAFSATLHNADSEESISVNTKEVSDRTIICTAENVQPGEYTLKLEAEYFFQNYEQKVTVEEGAKTTVVLSDSYSSFRGDGKTSPGVFALGDLNDDGMIDSTDGDLLIEYAGQSKTKTEYSQDGTAQTVDNDEFNSIYDLNFDGELNVGDLGILVNNMDTEKREAKPIKTVLPSAVTIDTVNSAVAESSGRALDTIMEDYEENIVLQPENAQQEISEANPVEIEMNFAATVPVEGIVISAPAESGPKSGTVAVEVIDEDDPNGATKFIVATIVDEEEQAATPAPVMKRAKAAARTASVQTTSTATAIRKADGSIVVDLGKQVAIKKVTIVVTATATSAKLTEIAKVEFLNDMETRIPEPEMNIPQNVQAAGAGDSFTVSWDAESNVTGYQVAISAIDKNGKAYDERFYNAGVNSIKIQNFKGGVKDKVTPLWTYKIRVKSVNGEWSSAFSQTVSHYQLAASAPDAPDNLKLNGKYRQIDASWKDMPGTEKYSLEYREVGTEEFTAVHEILSNSYSITGLKDATSYEIRVYGWNSDSNGNARRGGNSLPAIGKTTVEIPKFSKYAMITRDEIASVSCFATKNPGGPGGFDTTQYEDGIFRPEYVIDGDYSTFMHTNQGYPHGVTVEFTSEQTIKEIYMTNRLEDMYRDGTGYSGVYIDAWDADGNKVRVERPAITVQALNPTVKNTMKFTLATPIKAKKLTFGLSKYGAGVVTISEINFFKYDSLEDEVNALYADDMHITLKDNVTEEMISALELCASIKDPNFDEYHPKKQLLESELAYARELLTNKNTISDVVNVKADITKNGTNNCGFSSGLSGLQPLGYVAASDSKVNVYVGQKGKNVGDTVSVRLVFTQYHAESSAWISGEIALHHGKNEITIPQVSNLGFEKGGSLYIVHTNQNDITANPVSVRVSGATKIPMLDLHRTIGNDRFEINEAQWKESIRKYVQELTSYSLALQSNHASHQEEVGGFEYGNGSNCFLNATEISLDNVLISVPASQILAGLGGANTDVETLTNRMYDNAVSINQMLESFYKQRGFNPAAVNGLHGIPSARFNIRYQRMFAGAFMYAGGSHLGIEWGSVPGVANCTPIVTDENGKRIGGKTFGWGIAHELGHNADASGLTIAEVTNNIWSQFEKTWDTAETSRIPYAEVYKHVTSGSNSKPSNVFAQLGMFWQLHLAYDSNYANYNYYKDGFTTENYENLLANEFFARYYAIRRDSSKAPATAIKIANGTVEQNIMRVACAAAQKDLTDFFRAWGYSVDAVTAAYASQFPKEERQIQYLSDAAREYTLANGSAMTSTSVEASLVQGKGKDGRKVTLSISLPEEANMSAVLGYEIIRNGKPVAFVTPAVDENGEYADVTVYEDVVQTVNNRMMNYEVVAYDKYLNTTECNKLDSIKIRHEGVLTTENWTVTTNATSVDGVLAVYDGTKVVEGNVYTDVTTGESVTYSKTMDIKYLDKDTGETLHTYSAAVLSANGDTEVGFEGIATSTAQIVYDLGGKQEVTALAFMGGSTIPWKFMLEYSDNGGVSYTRITGFEIGTTDEGYPVLYFSAGQNIKSYKATHIRISSPNGVKTIGIKDIKLLSPSGDNVDIGVSTIDPVTGVETWDTDSAIGILSNDYVLDADAGSVIPAGSFIVTGKYTGNAAYNVVKLYSENYKLYDESTENKLDGLVNGYQAIFADMPEAGSIVNVRDGSWIYWLEPLSGENAGKFGLPGAGEDGSDVVVELPTKVYAELYRVDNALTLAGERLVSDSFVVDVPATLPMIELTNN
ncbi:MAG: M60 family metallopeptidase [Faecalibacterium sp.]|nr:M60 family metallopeptidase [Ruminococcus sp.]MCM1393088.1 M60 family metallopeptidase [Ruminococcus sp.]MCM1485284.1 M60 family metallopeptidase [Faecalibacterium sp.]